MKTKAEWLREFADAMEADPSGWWKQYEYMGFGIQAMQQAHSERELLNAMSADRPIRRKPRTVTRWGRDGNAVLLPEPMRSEPNSPWAEYYSSLGRGCSTELVVWGPSDRDQENYHNGNCFATQADAQAWASYFRSLLENRDD